MKKRPKWVAILTNKSLQNRNLGRQSHLWPEKCLELSDGNDTKHFHCYEIPHYSPIHIHLPIKNQQAHHSCIIYHLRISFALSGIFITKPFFQRGGRVLQIFLKKKNCLDVGNFDKGLRHF